MLIVIQKINIKTSGQEDRFLFFRDIDFLGSTISIKVDSSSFFL